VLLAYPLRVVLHTTTPHERTAPPKRITRHYHTHTQQEERREARKRRGGVCSAYYLKCVRRPLWILLQKSSTVRALPRRMTGAV
jgi:hypothetical protein